MIHTLEIARWRPAWLNELTSCHWRVKHRLKSMDAAVIFEAAGRLGIPKAAGKRRVGLTVYLEKRKREPDPDNCWKSLLDALARAGLLIDDKRKWCERSEPVFVTWGKHRGEHRTIITLEDIA